MIHKYLTCSHSGEAVRSYQGGAKLKTRFCHLTPKTTQNFPGTSTKCNKMRCSTPFHLLLKQSVSSTGPHAANNTLLQSVITPLLCPNPKTIWTHKQT